MNRAYYKTPGFGTSAQRAGNAGTWVELGSDAWKASWAAVRGTATNPTLTQSDSISINGTNVVLASGTGIADLVTIINAAGVAGVTSALVDGSIELFANSLRSETPSANTLNERIKKAEKSLFILVWR